MHVSNRLLISFLGMMNANIMRMKNEMRAPFVEGSKKEREIEDFLSDLSGFMSAFGYNLVCVITCFLPMVIANAV